jgi:SPW repeat
MKQLSWVNFILGLWVIAAAFAFLYGGASLALWDNVIVGIIIAILAAWRALAAENSRMAVTSWITALLGVWTLAAPFALRYSSTANAMWNNVVVGIVIAILATYRAMDRSGIEPLQHHNQSASAH